jgi:hypothetical protein
MPWERLHNAALRLVKLDVRVHINLYKKTAPGKTLSQVNRRSEDIAV